MPVGRARQGEAKKGSSYPPNISGNRDPLGWPEIKKMSYSLNCNPLI